MKKLLFIATAFTLLLSSCTKEESIEQDDMNAKMLESYVIKRNTNGSYSLTYQVSNGVNTAMYGGAYNEVQLYFDKNNTQKTFSKDYTVLDNELNIEFVTENSTFSPKIRIYDDNTVNESSRGTYGLLNDYSMSEDEDGSIVLNYDVEEGVGVNIEYNDVDKVHNIYLTPNTGNGQNSFSNHFSREDDGSLKIDFVQPNDSNARGAEEADYKKPRILIN